MTRKNFIKRLGGYGITRNTANKMAEIAHRHGETYEHAWALFLEFIDELHRRVAEAATHALLYGEGTACVPWPHVYFPFYNPALDFEIKPLSDPPPWQYLYAIDTAPIEPVAVIQWTKTNPHRCDTLDTLPYVCGIDLANGPDFTAGGGGHE